MAGEVEHYWLFILDTGETWMHFGLFKDACAKFAIAHQVSNLLGVVRK